MADRPDELTLADADFGALLRGQRRAAGLTQEELAERAASAPGARGARNWRVQPLRRYDRGQSSTAR